MRENARSRGESKLVALAFVAGVLTAGAMAVALMLFLVHRIGFQTIREKTGFTLTASVLELPDALIDELTALGAVFENAGNPTNAKPHDTFVVRPDEALWWVLRPDVAVDGYQLRARDRVNLDPPVLYLRADSPRSDALRDYLEAQARVTYTYHIDANGHRRTLPEVSAERKILMVGDSGVFGVGVGDEDTIASHLQRLVGDSHRVVNAGVGAYDGHQALTVARMLSERDDYDVLVYVGHHNDFWEPRRIANPDKARRIIADFEALRERFPGGIVVALLTYLEYTAADVLRSQGWERDRITSADRLRAELPAITAEAGLPFVDWTDIAEEVRRQEGTIFAPWSLYVDHAHLSARGNRLFAQRIHAAAFPPGSSKR